MTTTEEGTQVEAPEQSQGRKGNKVTLKRDLGTETAPDKETIAKIVGEMTAEILASNPEKWEVQSGDATDPLDFSFWGINVRIAEVNGHYALSVTYDF